MLTNLMTAQDAANTILRGATPNVDTDVAASAVALLIAKPAIFIRISPVANDGHATFRQFERLLDIAGLPDNHISLAGWIALRSCRPEPGDGLQSQLGCPIIAALLRSLGCVKNTTSLTIGDETAPLDAVRIATAPSATSTMGSILTSAGTIFLPASNIHSTSGEWKDAIDAATQAAALCGKRAYEADPDSAIELDWEAVDHRQNVEADAIHEDWHPEIARHPMLKRHPAALIQSATLATVKPPVATYKPRLTRRVIQSGLISDAQFEFIVAAGMAHSRHLPPSEDSKDFLPRRVGFYLADGTGAGKTNSILGAIIDNKLHGRTRSILVLAKRRHAPGFINAWKQLGQNPSHMICAWDYNPDDYIPNHAGTLILTYNMLRPEDETKPNLRMNQIEQWAGYDFSGIMAFDEAQEMRNAAGDENQSGKNSQISLQGIGGLMLQNMLPDARVIYASATGATDVHNLAYADRLGIWGAGTPFETRLKFIRTFEEGGISDLEQVTLSLKAQGIYMARCLSFEGVEVEHLPVTMTPDERRTYNEAANLWQEMFGAIKTMREICGMKESSGEGKTPSTAKVPHSGLNGIFEANRKNAMANLIASFKTRGVIEDIRKQLADGRHVVIQMQNTYEAQLDRALERHTDTSVITLEPAEMLEFAARLPVTKHEPVKTTLADGSEIYLYKPVMDAAGNPVEVAEAVRMRNELMAKARNIKLPLPPLDQIILTFGADRVAEITGRSKRLVPDRDGGRDMGATGVKLVKHDELMRTSDLEDFHANRKPILVFSTGAGGSSLSYHAKTGTQAGSRRRMHYLVQLGYRADEVTQGIGRTHRSDQVTPPVVSLVSLDLPADRLYASRIVNALFKLGALTQGHRHASSNGMFDERDCLDGIYAELAWKDLQTDIEDGLIRGYDWQAFMTDLGLNTDGSGDYQAWGKTRTRFLLTNVNQLINRVAALGDRKQMLIFNALREKIDARIERAIREGTFSAGPEVVKASSLSIISSHTIHTDPVFEAGTTLYRLRRVTKRQFTQFKDVYRMYLRSRGHNRAIFAKHQTTGAVALLAPAAPTITALGDTIPNTEVITPTDSSIRPKRIVDRERWRPLADIGDTLEEIWNATIESTENESVSYLTVVSGATLPIWPQLSHASGYHHAIYRLKTDDGMTLAARPLAGRLANQMLEQMGQSAAPKDDEINELIHEMAQDRNVRLAHPLGSTHVLKGIFNGPVMTGFEVTLFDAQNDKAVQSFLANDLGADKDTSTYGTWRYTGVPNGIRDALKDLLTITPATWVETQRKKVQAVTA